MAIARVNSTTGTNSVTFTSPAANYVQVLFAFRDGSNTAPTVPTPPAGNAWTVAPSAASGANTCSSVLVYRVVNSSSDTASGTFTNATSIVAAQYSGCDTTTPVGSSDSDTGASSTSINFNGFTFNITSGSSWAVGCMGHRQTDGTVTTAPSGMTNVTSVSDATDQAALHDTNGGVTGWSTTSASIGGTASGYRARVIELRAASGSYTMTAATGAFTLTGQAAGLTAQRKLTASVATFTLTGVAAGLYVGRKISAEAGAFAVTGVTAGLVAARKIAAEVGSFVFSGVAAGLNKGATLAASAASFIMTGSDAALTAQRRLEAASVALTLVGNSADLSHGGEIVPPPENTADIGPGDYSSIPKEFKLRGEVKRPRLKKSVVKKIKEVARVEPTRADLSALVQELAPFAAPDPITTEIQARIETSLAAILAGLDEARTVAAIQEAQRKERERIIIAVIAETLRQQEEDEILLAYII